jgi:sec-independent protein translocase protein TatC
MGFLSILNRRSKKNSKGEEREMSFVEHLDELRKHIIRSLIAIVSAAIFMFFLTDIVFKDILFYPLSADFPTYQLMCYLEQLLKIPGVCITPVKTSLQTFDMGEAFALHMKICIYGGLIISFPYVLWELWKFVKPGLYQAEVKATRGVVLITSFLFLLGIAFGYFVLAPFSINFLVGYQLPMINENDSFIKAGSFINYMIMFTFPAGILFELPVLIYYLAKIGILTDKAMRSYRKHSIVGILLLAAVVTPPDVLSQLLVAIPVYILYELSIGIAARQTRKREKIIGLNEDLADKD